MLEVDQAEDVDFDEDEHRLGIGLFERRESYAKQAKQRQPERRQLEYTTEFRFDDHIGSAPPQHEERAENVVPLHDREDRREVADRLRRVGDRRLGIGREEDVLEVMALERGPEQLERHGAVDSDEAAHAVECEAEAELKARIEARDQEEDQGEAGLASGHDRVEHARDVDLDGQHREVDRNREDAGVLSLVGIEEDVAAA